MLFVLFSTMCSIYTYTALNQFVFFPVERWITFKKKYVYIKRLKSETRLTGSILKQDPNTQIVQKNTILMRQYSAKHVQIFRISPFLKATKLQLNGET